MKSPYGYVRGTKKLGRDGDELDVFLGPDKLAKNAYVIMIKKAPDFKKDDEQKVMLGFNSAEEAKQEFMKHFDDPRFFGRMKVMSMHKFRLWVMSKPVKLAAWGEPQVYDGGYQHIAETKTMQSPPSLRKPKYVPSPVDPRERDDSLRDVTKRKDRAAQAYRSRLTRKHTDQNMKPLNTQFIQGFPTGTVGGFG
jgi:hypothetical protein